MAQGKRSVKCRFCGEYAAMIGKRSSAQFCSDLCRVRSHRMGGAVRCDDCSLIHASVRRGNGRCIYCLAHDANQPAKPLQEALAWLRERQLCVYCGEKGEQPDRHVPEAASCGECEGFVRSCQHTQLGLRGEYVRLKRIQRYRKLLDSPHWDDQELSEISPRLREYVEVCQHAAQLVRAQLSWPRWGE